MPFSLPFRLPFPFEPLPRASGQQIRNSAMARNTGIRSDFQKRLQNEGTLVHARVRQGQAVIAALQIIVNQEVQIQCSGPIGALSHASVPMLNFQQSLKQLMR